MGGPAKQRLDRLLVERGLAETLDQAIGLIGGGRVQVDGRPCDKAGCPVAVEAAITVRPGRRYVSRGGEKLEAGLLALQVDPAGLTCADIGCSTGGFTDCLLQAGAARVYAIDVGYGQLDYRLREDERVVPLERTNARYVDRLPEPVSLIVADASFISLRLLLPVFKGWIADAADVIVLIKPQFEAGKGQVGKGGVVRDPAIHAQVLDDVLAGSAP